MADLILSQSSGLYSAKHIAKCAVMMRLFLLHLIQPFDSRSSTLDSQVVIIFPITSVSLLIWLYKPILKWEHFCFIFLV